jgi:hypothetical protein
MDVRMIGPRIVLLASLTVLGACAGAGAIEDSPEARQQWAGKIVKLELESGDLDQRLDRGAELARAYSLDTLRLELGRELTDDELDRVLGAMRSVLEEFLTPEVWQGVLTEVYVEHFTAGEMQQVHAFFQSPAGSKILRLSAQLSEEIDAKSDALFEGRVDELVNRIDAELAGLFPELGEQGS